MQQVLEVAVGLVLVLAVVSLVVSATMELIASLFDLRARSLEQGVARMLDNRLTPAFWQRVRGLIGGGNPPDHAPISATVLNHPMIAALSSPRAANKHKTPSYIDSVIFATALLDTSVMGATLAAKFVDAKSSVDGVVASLAGNQSAAAAALRSAWAQSSGSPATLLALLQDNPDGPAAVALLMGTAGSVAARITALEESGDPAAPRLREAWTAASGDVATFAAALETPRLISAAVDGADAVTTAIAAMKTEIPHLGRPLEQLWIRAGGDFSKFRLEVEDWYDREMKRVSGWYTRWTKWIMVGIGLAIALALNMSVTTIGRSLWKDPTLRSNVVAEATAIVKQYQQTTTASTATPAPTPAPTVAPASTKCALPGSPAGTGTSPAGSAGATGVAGYTCLQSIDLPIGWTGTAWPGPHPYLLIHLLGIVMLGIATSFGAPFWFGLLGALINVRGSGPPPAEAAKQRSSTSSS